MRNIVRIEDKVNKKDSYVPENIEKGNPTASTNNQYTDPTNTLSSGVWSSEPGVWRFEQTGAEEFCYLIDGVIRLTHENGQSNTFNPGDAFIIPIGFRGTWETVKPMRKFYANCEIKNLSSKL
jgi:hypothetical protein